MIEPVSAVSSAPASIPGAGPASPSGGSEAVGEPLPVPTVQEVAGFDDVARALRAEAVTASPVPRRNDRFSRATGRAGEMMDRLSRAEAKIMAENGDLFGGYKRPEVAVFDPGPPEGSGADVGDHNIRRLEAAFHENQRHMLEMVQFSVAATIVNSVAGEFRDSIKKLAEGNA